MGTLEEPSKDGKQLTGGIPLETEEDYDPHAYRFVEKPTNNFETLVHILKGCLGTGILAMPEGFLNAGMLNGIVCTFLIGILCTFCLHMLVKTQYILCQKLRIPLLSYPESMKICLETGPKWLKSFARSSFYIVDFFLVFYQVGICCVYIVFVAVNIKAVVDEHVDNPIKVEYYILSMFIPFLLMTFVRNLKLLAPFSTFANVLTAVSFGILLYYIFAKQPMPKIRDRASFGSFYTFPLYFGTTLFALETVGVVIALENNMKTPKSFGGWFGVLNIAMFTVTTLYVIMGFLGYWKYGEKSAPSVTLNLPPKEWLAQTVNILYSIAIYISYALQGYVAIWILWESYIYKRVEGHRFVLLWEYLVRSGVVIITFILAVTIPFLGLFISLFGAFCLSALGIVFPCLMEICVKWPMGDYGFCKWILLRDIILMLIGFIGLLSGSYSSISEIVRAFGNKTKS